MYHQRGPLLDGPLSCGILDLKFISPVAWEHIHFWLIVLVLVRQQQDQAMSSYDKKKKKKDKRIPRSRFWWWRQRVLLYLKRADSSIIIIMLNPLFSRIILTSMNHLYIIYTPAKEAAGVTKQYPRHQLDNLPVTSLTYFDDINDRGQGVQRHPANVKYQTFYSWMRYDGICCN